MPDAPLGDLIYDLLHAIVLNDEVEMEESALALAKATAKGVADSRIEGSPTLPAKLTRLRRRLKEALGGRGITDDDEKEPASKTDEWGLPSVEDLD
ncbi:MAG: hypothetical protein ACYTGE_11225 [Planctomycetota bacterium]|jgi:hypothetical protein